jgi:N-6 DNA Methylase
MADPNEVTAADIARIAGVGRAAVSNWRRRHADFPRPIGGPATSPTFSLDDVQEWLRANGRSLTVNTETTSHSAFSAFSGSSAFSESRLAVSIAALLPPLHEGVVLGTQTDDGGVLEAAAVRFGTKVRYVDRDIDDPTGIAALSEFRLAADIVVSTSPLRAVDPSLSDHLWEFGPPSQVDGALASMQLAYGCVKRGGTALVLMPFSAAVRASGRRIRAELLRSGALRRVIALPTQVSRPLAAPLQIWMLERPVSRPTYTVDMVDMSDARPADLPLNPELWEALLADPTRSRSVAAIELLDDDVLLVPTSHIEPPERDFAAELTTYRRSYRRSVAALDDTVPTFPVAREPIRLPMATIADLARLGALEFADRHGPLESGDVVIAGGTSRFEATVVNRDQDAHDASTQTAEVIRCDAEQLDPYFVACFLRSEANRRQASGTLGGTFRLDVRRARIPRIPLGEQQPYADTYRRIVEFAGRAEAVAETAADVVQVTVDGLTAGALAPTNTTSQGTKS